MTGKRSSTAGTGFPGKPTKASVTSGNYGQAVSTAAKAMGAARKSTGMAHSDVPDMKPMMTDMSMGSTRRKPR